MIAAHYEAELAMSRLVSKQLHSRGRYCYERMFLEVLEPLKVYAYML